MKKNLFLKCLTLITLILLGLNVAYFSPFSIMFFYNFGFGGLNTLGLVVFGSVIGLYIFFVVVLPLIRKILLKTLKEDKKVASCLNILSILFLLVMGAGVIFLGIGALSLILLLLLSLVLGILGSFANFIPFPIIIVLFMLVPVILIATMKEDNRPNQPRSHNYDQIMASLKIALIVSGILLFRYDPKIWESIYTIQQDLIMGFSGFLPNGGFDIQSFYQSSLRTFYKPVLLFFEGITNTGWLSLFTIFLGLILYFLYPNKIAKSLMLISSFLLPFYIAMVTKGHGILGDVLNQLGIDRLIIDIIIFILSGLVVYYLLMKSGLLYQKKC